MRIFETDVLAKNAKTSELGSFPLRVVADLHFSTFAPDTEEIRTWLPIAKSELNLHRGGRMISCKTQITDNQEFLSELARPSPSFLFKFKVLFRPVPLSRDRR